MTREEAIEIIEENRPNYRDWQEEFDEAVERLKQPLTLADFLGWEEGIEHEYGLTKYKLENGRLMQYFDEPYLKGWFESRLSINNVGILKQDDKEVLIISGKVENHRYKTKLTKHEWAELGITRENADFEEVES